MECSRPHVYPDLTQALQLGTLFTITLLITPLIVPKYLRLIKLVKDMPDSVGTFSSLLQLLNQVRPHFHLAHYVTDITVERSATFSSYKHTCLTQNMPIRYNVLHALMIPADVSEDAANLQCILLDTTSNKCNLSQS